MSEKNLKYPLREDFYIGENPSNLDPEIYNDNPEINYDELIPLPEFILKMMPSYLIGCGEAFFNPDTKQIVLDIRFDKNFEIAFKNYYSIKRDVSNEEICQGIKQELEKIYKNL